MRKICFYIEQYGQGGVDTHLYSLINHWPNHKDNIYILSNYGNRGLRLVQKNIRRNYRLKLFDVPTLISLKKSTIGKIFGKFLRLLFPFIFIYQIYFLCRIFQSYKFDIIFCDNGSYPGGVSCQAAILAAFILRIRKRYLLIHHWAIPRKKIFYLFEWLIDNIVSKVATKVIAVSNATKETLIKLRGFNPNRTIVIYNGIELERSKNFGKVVNLRQKCNVNNGTYFLGILGNIEPHKGHDVLLRAMHLINHGNDMHLCVIGSREDADYYDALTNMVKELKLEKIVTFTGFIEGCSLGLVRQLDLLVMPTKNFEAFGYVLAEAMLEGTPVIASNVGAIPELINDRETGILVEPLDASGLSEAILSLKENENMRKRLIEQGKNRIRIKFTASRMAEEFYSLPNLRDN